MKFEDLFEIRNGVARSGLVIFPAPVPNSVPYLRPSCSQQRTVAGWVSESDIDNRNIYPEGTLFVSTDGSPSYAYVSRFRFVGNSNVSVLLPKRDMTLNEKIFYARCITMNRFRFSYGRKPKGTRLKQIELPDVVPDWVLSAAADDVWNSLTRIKKLSKAESSATSRSVMETVRVQDVFDVRYGHSLELNRLQLLPRDAGGIPFVSRTMENNGVSAYVAPIEGIPPIDGGVLSCALGGSVLATFLQENPFYSGYHLAYLVPKIELTTEELLYYCSCIRQNRFRYSYGRQANRTLKDLLIPARESIPGWVSGSISRVLDELIIGRDKPAVHGGEG
jgi:hypothetical protein